MIIEIILINFFQKYYMNKNLKNTLINNFPLISILILGAIYIYLNAPDNLIDTTINKIFQQKGGDSVETFDYPPNTPMMYQYRFAFIIFPIILIILIIYYAVFYHISVKNITIWSLGLDFFANFQKQYKAAIDASVDPKDLDYTYQVLPKTAKENPEFAKFINMIQIASDPLAGLYLKSQYFCNAARPCNCCLDDNYTKYFFNCTNADKSCSTNAQYRSICLPTR
jgi:hypothetical protein